ncbi:unnamed protein product [Amoebophrya sp. A25]|nr:unnamed protein product [Amoebophrya sp. A25]|eukprot:GSA25T00009772001.1
MSGMQLFLSSALDWTCEGFHPSKSTSLGFTSHCFIPEDPSPGCATGWVRQANKKLSDGYNSMLTGATSTSRARSSFLHTSIGPAAEQQCATTTASFFASGSKQRLPKRLCTVQSSILPDANAAEKTCFFGADTTRDEQVDKDVRMLARSAKRGGRRTGAAKKRWTSFPGEQGNAGGEDEADEEGEDGENGEEADEEDGAGDGEKEDDGKN